MMLQVLQRWMSCVGKAVRHVQPKDAPIQRSLNSILTQASTTVLARTGCVYEAATNFNPLANDDDGSCVFEDGGNNDCPADLDQDGTVATADLLLFLSGFGQSCN